MSNLCQLTNEFQQLAAMDADDEATFAEALADTLQATDRSALKAALKERTVPGAKWVTNMRLAIR